MKKLISLILAFAMVFSLAMPAFAADTNTTLYFKNTAGWSTVYAYYWSDSNTGMVTWPGTAMTLVNGETDVYAIEVPSEATYIIFNDGNVSMTDDLIIPTDGKNLCDYSTGIWSTYGSAGDTSDQTKGDVTASYTPKITISGVTISGDSVTTEGTTYTVTIPADETLVDVTVSGQNLDKIAVDDYSYMVSIGNLTYLIKASDYDPDTGKAVASFTLEASDIGTADLQYSTDGGTTWTDTGWNVVIQQAEPEPTAVSLKAKLKAVDSAGAEITDTMIASLDGNTVVNTEIKEYNVIFTGNQTMTWDMIPSGYKTPADVSVTVTDTDGDGVGELTSNSSHATVELVDGVYVITVTLEKDESTGDTPTLPEIIYLKAEGATVASIASFFDSNGDQIVDENGAPMAAAMTAVEGEEDIFSVATGSFPEGAAAIVFYTDNGGSEQLNLSGVTGDIDMFTFGTEVNANGQTLGTWGTYTPSSTGDTTATIAGVSITVDGKEYTSGNVTITPDSTVTLTVTGTNLQNGTEDNLVAFASGVSAHVTSSYFEFSTDGTTATLTVPNGSFVNSSNFEISYTNDGQQSWTSAGIYVTYDAGTPDTYDVNIAVVENGTVSADMQTAAEDDIVTLTVSPAADYQIGSVTVKDAEGNIVEFTETGAVSGTYKFIMPASDVTVEATFTAIEKTSADIAWGSMAFTYTDGENGAEGAWSNDGSEKAGTVTVTNTGTTAITATPSYAATTDEYGTFTGSFDEDSIGIDAGANWTFKLTLDGTPTKAIPAGTKIGTVTITITEGHTPEIPESDQNVTPDTSETPSDDNTAE